MTALSVLFPLIVLALLANTVGLVRRSLLLSDLEAIENMSPAEISAVDLWAIVPGGIYLVLALITAAVFIPWQYRHAKNAQLLGQNSGLGPGWAIGGWFIPLANFVLPALQLRGANRWSRAPGSRPGSPSMLIVAWMACMVVGNIVIRVSVANEPAPAAGLRAYVDWVVISDRAEAGGTLVVIAAAVLALLMVRQLSAQQEAQRPAPSTLWSTPSAPWSGPYGGYPAQGGYPSQGGYPAQGGYPSQGGYPAEGGYPPPAPPPVRPWPTRPEDTPPERPYP